MTRQVTFTLFYTWITLLRRDLLFKMVQEKIWQYDKFIGQNRDSESSLMK